MLKFDLLISRSSVLLLALAAIFTTVESKELEAQETDGNTTIEELSEDKNNTSGKEVTVRGKVEKVDPGVSFAIEEEGFLEGDRVLVINVSDRVVPENTDDLQLQVTGKLRTLVLADVERDYELDLDPQLYAEYETKPVILATNLILSPDLEDISEDPESYYDLEIAVEGEVDKIRNDYAFTLKEDQLIGGDDLLIINATDKPLPKVDEKIAVTGTVRPYIKADIERDYDLTWDLDVQQQIEAEYSEKPVLVVDSIYPAAKNEGLLE